MTKYIIQFSARSLIDIEEAVNYYNGQAWGLGNKFLSDIEMVFKALITNPFFASVKYEDIRCAALKRFPFSIHYSIDKKKYSVIILAVFNTWKKPFW